MRLVLSLLLLTGCWAADIPRPAPEFVVQGVQGGQLLLSGLRGNVTVLALISTTCQHCQEATKDLSAIQNRYRSRKVKVVAAAFNPEAPAHVADFVQQFRPTFPVGYSPRSAVLEFLQLGPDPRLSVPIIVLIDKRGRIRSRHLGGDTAFYEDLPRSLSKELDDLLAMDKPRK
jgi:peroxiredoxin